MNDILERIHGLAAQKQIKITQMLKDTGISTSTFYTWKERDSVPSTEYIIQSANYFNVTTDYLLGLDEEKGDDYYFDDELKSIANELKNNPGQKVLFNATRDCKAEDILKVVEFIQERIQRGEDD